MPEFTIKLQRVIRQEASVIVESSSKIFAINKAENTEVLDWFFAEVIEGPDAIEIHKAKV